MSPDPERRADSAKLSVDDVRDHYDGLSFGEFSYGDRRSGFYPLVDDFVALAPPGAQVCDVGCGAGFWLEDLTRRGIAKERLLGIDLAPDNVRRAQARGFRAQTGNVLNLDIPTASFDATFCAGVIHHTPDPQQALRELARITRPAGHIYLGVYNKLHPYFWLVHKATAPLRTMHWRGWRGVSDTGYMLWKLAVQPVSYVAFGRALDEQTCRALYMDQVLTPYAFLYSQGDLKRQAEAAGLEVVKTGYALRSLMIEAILRPRAADQVSSLG